MSGTARPPSQYAEPLDVKEVGAQQLLELALSSRKLRRVDAPHDSFLGLLDSHTGQQVVTNRREWYRFSVCQN